MRTCLAIVCLAFTLVVTPACTKASPNLSPQAQSAFQKTRIIKALDILQDTAITAEAQTPKVLSTATARQVVQGVQSALRVIDQSAAGWPVAVAASLDELVRNLPQQERLVVSPYVALAKTLLQEVRR